MQILDGQVEHPYVEQLVQTPLRIYLPIGHSKRVEALNIGGF